MASRINAVAVCLAVVMALATPAQARVYWSSIASGCMPERLTIQDDRYTSARDSAVALQQGSVDPVVLICTVAIKGGGLPTILSMTYQDSTGNDNAANIVAQLVQINRANGARGVVSSVSSDSSAKQTVNRLQSAPFLRTLDFEKFYYYVRIAIARTVATQVVESIGVALEVPPIASFVPARSYARVATTTNAPTFPQPLTVTLSEPAASDTMVTVTSGDPAALTTSDVTILSGNTSAPVEVTAVAQSMNVGVTASLSGQILTAHVRVLGVTEQPVSVTLSPASRTVAAGGATTFKVTLDLPPSSDASVNLSVSPANAGTLPASVTVSANQTSATFNYTDGGTVTDATITATFNSSFSSATVTVTQQ